MTLRVLCRFFLVAGATSALLALGSVAAVPSQAGASLQKNHPPKKHASSKATANELKGLAKDVESGKGSTYQAVYTVTSEGHAETVTFAQTGSKYLFKTTSGSMIDTGTQTLYCGTTGTCVSEGTTTVNPAASLRALFSPTEAESFFTEARVELGAKEAGYSVKVSNATFAGQKSVCVSVSGHGVTGKWCVTNSGILAYSGSSAGSFSLTSFTRSPASGDFTLPAGATIETLP